MQVLGHSFNAAEFNNELAERLVSEFAFPRRQMDVALKLVAGASPLGPCVLDSLNPQQSRFPMTLDCVLWHSTALPRDDLAEALGRLKATKSGRYFPGTLTDDQNVDLSLFVSIDWRMCLRLGCIPLRLNNGVLAIAQPPFAATSDDLSSEMRNLGPGFEKVSQTHNYVVPTLDFVDHLRQVRRFNELVQPPPNTELVLPFPTVDESNLTTELGPDGNTHVVELLDADQMVLGSNALIMRLLGLLVYAIKSGNLVVCGRLISGLNRVALQVTPPSVPLILLNQMLSNKLGNSALGPDWIPPVRLLSELYDFYSHMRAKIARQVPRNAEMLSSVVGRFDECVAIVYGNSSSCWQALEGVRSSSARLVVLHVLNTRPDIAALQMEGAFRAQLAHHVHPCTTVFRVVNWAEAMQEAMARTVNAKGSFGAVLLLGAASLRADGSFCEAGSSQVIRDFADSRLPNSSVWLIGGRYKEIRRLSDEMNELCGRYHEFVSASAFNGTIG